MAPAHHHAEEQPGDQAHAAGNHGAPGPSLQRGVRRGRPYLRCRLGRLGTRHRSCLAGHRCFQTLYALQQFLLFRHGSSFTNRERDKDRPRLPDERKNRGHTIRVPGATGPTPLVRSCAPGPGGSRPLVAGTPASSAPAHCGRLLGAQCPDGHGRRSVPVGRPDTQRNACAAGPLGDFVQEHLSPSPRIMSETASHGGTHVVRGRSLTK